MNDRLKKQLHTYKRSLENKKVYASLYTIVLLFTLVIYGFFGVYPLIRVTERKFNTLNELTDLNRRLLKKKANINDTKEALEKARFYTNELESAIPLRPEVEDFMVSLVGEAGSDGYRQRNFYIQDVLDGEVTLRAKLRGSAGQFTFLIADIETMDRLTKINSFRYSLREDTASVEVNLMIYFLER